jgi:hypothetical protein
LHYFDEKRYFRNSSLFKRMLEDNPISIRWKRQFRSYILRKVLNRSGKKEPLRIGWHLKYFFGRYNDRWYESLFRNSIGLSGEVNPSYALLDKATIKYMQSRNPELKVIYILRNPIDRAWSHATMHFTNLKKLGYEDITPKAFEKQVNSTNSRNHTNYLRNIRRWGSVFSPDQIFISFLEDLSQHNVRLMSSVFEFLEVIPMSERKVIRKRVHKGSANRIPTEFAIKIAQLYMDEIKQLNEVFGGYSDAWLESAEKLISDPPDIPSIEYPLSYSSLWQEQAGELGTQEQNLKGKLDFQSGELSSFPNHQKIWDT